MSTFDRDPYAGHDPFRLHVFVPALMSAGLLFSLLTLGRDALAGRAHRGRRRRSAIAAAAVAGRIQGGEPAPGEVGLRPRRFYLLVAVGAGAGAAYLLPGAVLNYARHEGYVSDIAWLLVTSVVVGVLAALAAVVAGSTWLRWPAPPGWALRAVSATWLGAAPGSPGADGGRGVDPVIGGALVGVATAFGVLALGVGAARRSFAEVDERVSEAVAGWSLPSVVDVAAVLGRADVALVAALLVGAVALRCRVAAVSWAVAVAATFALDSALREVVERPGPRRGDVVGLSASFPSGHVAQVALLACGVPLVVRLLSRRRGPTVLAAGILALATVATAVTELHDGTIWPSDALGGALLGAGAGLAAWWAVAHRGWHSGCAGCPWLDDRRVEDGPRSVIAVPAGAVRLLRVVAGAWTMVTLTALAVVAVRGGMPTDPDGEGALAVVEQPAQLALLALAALGAVVAWRLPATGATVMASAAFGLGLVASVERPPWVVVGVTVAVGVPAFLFWLTWQRIRSHVSVVALALLAVSLLAAQAAAAGRVYDHFFGPSHPTSATADVPVDRVEWAWTGDLRPDGATIVARLAPADADVEATLVVRPEGGRARPVAEDHSDADGIVRLRAVGLTPDTEHTWQVVVAGASDRGRGQGRLRTAPEGAASFTLAAGACARTGSDGAVFDAIRAADPLLYLAAGDLHYTSIDATDTGPYLNAYRKVLTSPAQAALARDVPVDYVWDDHDYGPNDADAASPSRGAAWASYRAAVPHPPLPSDGAIYHASTIGRVRVVVTDTRSARTGDSMLGDEQLSWLRAELRDADRYGAVIWVNPDPWIAPDDPTRDDWGGFAEERRLIADTIVTADVDNLVMVAGDAHMVAIDDGTNSDYATAGGAGFPILHAAALDRPGNVKGGPYSEGAYPGGGQFGLVHIDDDGEVVRVGLEGRDWTGRTIARLDVTLG